MIKESEANGLALTIKERVKQSLAQESNYLRQNDQASYDKLMGTLKEIDGLISELKAKVFGSGKAEIDRAYLADRTDARAREVSIVKATGKRDVNLMLLGSILRVGASVMDAFRNVCSGEGHTGFLLRLA